MSNKATTAGIPAMRLFERLRPRIVDLPGVRQLLQGQVAALAEAVRRTAALDVTVTLEHVEQEAAERLCERQPGIFNVLISVPQWRSQALVCIDSVLFFRALDAMYGGDPIGRRVAPARALTPLEKALLLHLMRALSEPVLAALEVSGQDSPRVVDELNPQLLGGARAEYIIARYRLSEHGDRVILAVPAPAFENYCDQLSVEENDGGGVQDPAWTSDFESRVGASSVVMMATMEGPRIPLSAIANLQPGALIEFGGEAIRSVLLMSETQPVFSGRLGQSRGFFTICLEQPVRSLDS